MTAEQGRPAHAGRPGLFTTMHALVLLFLANAAAALAQSSLNPHPPPAVLAPRARPAPPPTLPEKVEPSQVYLAVPIDQAGRLHEALPLYRARAEQTETSADRLRYGGALLRAGEGEEAGRVFDAILAETRSGPHGQTSSGPMLVASTMLREGFPALAVERLRPAYRPRPESRRMGLLLARALAAAGDRTGAHAVLAELGTGLETWDASELIELARADMRAGDRAAARALLNREIAESIGQMMRDSVLADGSLLEDDWTGAARLLADGKRKGPPGLDEERVSRTWRNLQRELRWMQLRLGLALWKQGKADAAMKEVAQAAMSDEEPVRTSAVLLAVAGDLAQGRREGALRRLDVLGGHDRRFQPGVEEVKVEMTAGREPAEGLRMLEEALAGEDRSVTVVTRSVIGALREAARPAGMDSAKRTN